MKGKLKDARFQCTVLSDELETLRRNLHSAESSLRQSAAAALKLKMQLQDVHAQKGIFSGRFSIFPDIVTMGSEFSVRLALAADIVSIGELSLRGHRLGYRLG